MTCLLLRERESGGVSKQTYSRLKEFFCTLFGHEFNENYWKEEESGFVLEHEATCTSCGISITDISGTLQRYAEKYPSTTHIKKDSV